MKKLFYFFIFTTIVALASCAQDDTVVPEVEGDFNVSFEVSTTTDETDPQAVRAYNDGKKIRDLEYAIYKKETDGTYKFIKAVDAKDFFSADSQSGTFNEKLGYKKTYVIMLWADCTDDNYILNWSRENINDCTAAIYQKDKLVSQDDNADAFFAKVEFVADESNKSIDLTRPFAQVNVCTNDYDAAVTRGFTATQTSMKVNAYTSLNLFSGAVGDKQDITFAFAALPSGEDASIDVNGTTYKRIAMNYLFAPAENEDTSITFYANNTSNSLTWDNIGIARNRRTNICGSLLSDNNWDVYYTNFDVKVMTWNVCCAWNGTDGYIAEISGKKIGHPWSVRRAAIAQRIIESDADVICLQELNCTDPVKFFRDIMQLLNGNGSNLGSNDSYYNGSILTWPVETYNGNTYYGLMIKRGSSSGFDDEGNAIIYKKSMFTDVTSNYDKSSPVGYFWLSNTPNQQSIYPDANCKRICLYKRLKHNATGKEFVVACTHIDNSHDAEDKPGYDIMNSQVQILINNLRANTLTTNEQRGYDDTEEADKLDRCPVIIGGDMNANPSISSIQRFGYNIAGGYRTEANPSNNTGSNNDFADCYVAAERAGATMTYPFGEVSRSTMVDIKYDASTNTAYVSQNGAEWDYIFMRWGNTVKSYQIHSPFDQTFVYNGTTYNNVFLSDHNAVSAVINLRYND